MAVRNSTKQMLGKMVIDGILCRPTRGGPATVAPGGDTYAALLGSDAVAALQHHHPDEENQREHDSR